jgi:hypothetical protein
LSHFEEREFSNKYIFMSRTQHGQLPKTIVDRESNTAYDRRRFLGKGGFAECFEFENRKTKKIIAGKGRVT